jgi:AraC family transcriptional regulator
MHVLEKGNFLGEIRRFSHNGGITTSVTDYLEGDVKADCMHFHKHPNIYFVIRGGSVETCRRQQHERLAGSVVFYRAGEPHRNIRKGFPGKSINVEIELDALARYHITEPLIEAAVRTNINSPFVMLAMYRELQINDADTSASLQMLVLDTITSSIKLLSTHKWPDWIKQVREILHDRPGENISLDELSVLTRVNPITICKHFSGYFGCTLGDYVRKLKIAKALGLVKNTRMPLTEIAFECGFADQSHFIRNFKRYTGMLPNYYRAKM